MLDSSTEAQTQAALRVIFKEIRKLKALGWQPPHPDDKKHTSLLILEAESTGIHEGYCDSEGDYWIFDDYDLAPSHPLLVRPSQ